MSQWVFVLITIQGIWDKERSHIGVGQMGCLIRWFYKKEFIKHLKCKKFATTNIVIIRNLSIRFRHSGNAYVWDGRNCETNRFWAVSNGWRWTFLPPSSGVVEKTVDLIGIYWCESGIHFFGLEVREEGVSWFWMMLYRRWHMQEGKRKRFTTYDNSEFRLQMNWAACKLLVAQLVKDRLVAWHSKAHIGSQKLGSFV